MGIYSKYKYVNPVMGGTYGLTLPTGQDSGDRGSPPVGTIRYNTALGLVEQFNALGWQSVDAPPTVSNFSGVINENTTTTLTITGSNFKTGATCSITGAAVGGIDRALATTWVSASTVTVSTNATSVSFIGGASYGIKIVNPSGLGGVLDPAGVIDRDPIWSTASTSGSPTVIYDTARGSTTVAHTASDADGNAITYSVQSGSLPTGASLNTSTGAVSGFSAVGSDTTSTYTLRATSTSSTGSLVSTQDRAFQITVKAPVTQTYTSSTAWTAPFTGTIQVLVVGGGGAGGGGTAGGGGAGGLVVHPAYPVSINTPYTVTVGAGGPMPTAQNTGNGNGGQSSVFGGIVANGGGGGSGYPTGSAGGNGGSGGGAGQYPGMGGPYGHGSATANTTQGGTGYGNPGGQYSGSPGSHGGGGGGGAGGGGQGGPQGNGGVGLAFPQFDGTVRAGGGQGATNVDQTKGNAAGGGGRGGPGGQQNGSPYPGSARGGESGTANTGGGGGGGWDYGGGGAGQGGSGIVIIKY